MKVRVGNWIYDESCKMLPNGDLLPASRHASINAAKVAMRRAKGRAFRSYKEITEIFGSAQTAYQVIVELTQSDQPRRPPGDVETGASNSPEVPK